MEIKVSLLENVKFSIQARSHTILCDRPTDNLGTESGMTPPELMLASLGSCAAFSAIQFLEVRNLPDRGIEVTVTVKKLMQPGKTGELSRICGVSRTSYSAAD